MALVLLLEYSEAAIIMLDFSGSNLNQIKSRLYWPYATRELAGFFPLFMLSIHINV